MLLLEQLSLVDTTDATAASSTPLADTQGTGEQRGVQEGNEALTLNGRWQMIVTTEGAWPSRLQYAPALELIEIEPDAACFRLESRLGPLATIFTGACEWKQAGRLTYMVDEMQVKLGGINFKVPASYPENELLVFAAADQIAVARTRSGGMMLLCRPL
ncbi:MAG: hypothetical protein WDW36_001413 [Sanguina aurantia]